MLSMKKTFALINHNDCFCFLLLHVHLEISSNAYYILVHLLLCYCFTFFLLQFALVYCAYSFICLMVFQGPRIRERNSSHVMPVDTSLGLVEFESNCLIKI
uniref:Uncharacterized protein n=1 Tax=Zea mays TaxID=4577 RepID=A0A804Q5V1_MAIZE